MNDIAKTPSELMDESPFFAPASTDMVDGLVGRYQQERDGIDQVAEFLSSDRFGSSVRYFIEGNQDTLHGLRYAPATEKLFRHDGAIGALNSNYWQQALSLTDVLDFMPAKRREEWFDSIQKMQTPDFEEATVRATLGELLAMRMQFLAERVDGIFQALSRTHVTNEPQGFGKRMIMSGVTNDYGAYSRSQTGHINDLRSVVAKFMGRDEPDWNASNKLVEIARADHRGEWLDVDGNALRIRCYKNGNAHLEVHPDMAWRLNQILAHLHPAAIPSQFRTPPKRKAKQYEMVSRPLPFAVLHMLGRMGKARTERVRSFQSVIEPETDNPNSLRFEYGDHNKHIKAEAERVLASIGGVKIADHWEFDYPPRAVINEIIASGCIPDQKSHQFYPTPEVVAEAAIKMAGVEPDHWCLEPSAGIGGLADRIPECQGVTCVEISPLHCKVLEAKSRGYSVLESDFIEWAEDQDMMLGAFDRIVMNPPFSEGRWLAHLRAALGLLKEGGRLVAILPASARGKDLLPGWSLEWSEVFAGEFAGTSVSVVILSVEWGAA